MNKKFRFFNKIMTSYQNLVIKVYLINLNGKYFITYYRRAFESHSISNYVA